MALKKWEGKGKKEKKNASTETRTQNLLLRREAHYPLCYRCFRSPALALSNERDLGSEARTQARLAASCVIVHPRLFVSSFLTCICVGIDGADWMDEPRAVFELMARHIVSQDLPMKAIPAPRSCKRGRFACLTVRPRERRLGRRLLQIRMFGTNETNMATPLPIPAAQTVMERQEIAKSD